MRIENLLLVDAISLALTEVQDEGTDRTFWGAHLNTAVQCEVGAEGVDGHVGVGIVERVAGSEVEHRLVLAASAVGFVDAVEVGGGALYVRGVGTADGDTLEGRGEVVAAHPLDDVGLTSLDGGDGTFVCEVQC